VVDADDPAPVLGRVRMDDRHVDHRDPMVLVVIGEEGEHRVLIAHLGVEHRLIPLDHLLEAAGAVNHMDEPGGAYARHDGLPSRWLHGGVEPGFPG